MSTKVQTFANKITNPLNIHNFEIVFPSDVDESIGSSLLVQSTTFPTEEMRIVTLYVAGEPVRYPTIPQNSGSWAFKIPESDDGSIRKAFETLKQKIYNQATGIVNPLTNLAATIEIKARDLQGNVVFSTTLVGVWIQGRGEVSLSNQDPSQNWNWDYKFVYQYILDSNLE